MNLIGQRARFSVGSVVLVVVLVYGAALAYIASKAAWAEETLGEIEPRYARLLGVRGAADEIRQARGAAEAELAQYSYPPASGVDRVGADLQQRLRTVAEKAGVAVSGSQIVTGKADRGLEEVVVSMTMEADLAQLHGLLSGLRSLAPAVYIDTLAMQPTRAVGSAGQRVNVQARFVALKVQQ